MPLAVAASVLLAAALHASWNALVKHSRDPLLALATVIATAGAVGACMLPLVGPPPRAALPFLAGSMLLHAVYHVLLSRAYHLGDLSQVYPIARGVAPPLVALLAAAAGETPSRSQAIGLGVSSLAIASLGLGGDRRARGAVGFALATGTVIACYSLVDGQGSRVSGVLTFIAWAHVLDVIPMGLIVWFSRRGRIRDHLRRDGLRCAAGGVIGIATYSIVLWAMTRAPLAAVSALRESSVVFAALLGALWLREPVGARRIAAALGVCAGGALLMAPR